MREEEEEYKLNTKLLTYNIKVSKLVSNKVRKIEDIDTEVVGIIITNLLACVIKGQALLYSRNTSRSSAEKTKYNKRGITAHRIMKAVDRLVEEGLICNQIGKPNAIKEKRVMSFIAPTQEFIEEFCTQPEQALIALSEYNAALQTIILRNEYGNEINYQDTDNIRKARVLLRNLMLLMNLTRFAMVVETL